MSSRRELDDTAPATEVPSDPGRRSRPDTFVPPTERYQLGIEIGRGGMGRVVEALDTKLGRTVALKEVLPRAGESVERRFLREVRVTARLEHPSIVPLYDSGVNAEGRPFYVMRRVTGRPLDELIKSARGLDERLTLLPAVLRAIDAIAHAHKRGVIHRDIKPGNILVGELGESVVIDWGLAKVIGESEPDETDSLSELKASDSLQTQFGSVFGTPGFMPPEQARGESLGFGGDVYALGATLYQLLAGTPPHQGTSVTDVMDKTLRTEVRPLRALAPGAPVELAAIVDKALAYESASRYRDASELAADVRRFEAGQLVAAHHYTSRQKVGRFVRRYRSLLVLGAVALTALSVFAVLGLQRVYAEKRSAQEARDRAQDNAAKLQEQAHELTLANATALINTNPTKALAYLKQIPVDSRWANRARGLAQSAYARGPAFAMQGPSDFHRVANLSPSETRVLWQNRETELRVYDLADARAIYVRALEVSDDGVWVDDDHILLSGKSPEVIDLRTGVGRRIAIAPVRSWSASKLGKHAVAILEDRSVRIVDLATSESVQVGSTDKAFYVTMASDETWVAIPEASGLITFFDLAGGELGRLDRQTTWVTAVEDGSFVASGFNGVFRCRRETTPICIETELFRDPKDVVTITSQTGSSLLVATSRDILHVVEGDRVDHFQLPVKRISLIPGNAQVPLGPDSDTIYIPTSVGWMPIKVPHVLSRGRVAVGQKRVVVFGDGIITVYELATLLPRRFGAGSEFEATYVTDTTIAMNGFGMLEGISWLDARTLEVVAHTDVALPIVDTFSTADGGLLGVTPLPGGRDESGVYYVPHRGAKLEPITRSAGYPIASAWADGTALIVRNGNEVIADRTGEPAMPVMALPGDVIAITTPDLTHFAALLTTNELVIGEPATQKLERYPLGPVPEDSHVAARDGVICATFGRTLLVWRDGKFVELARLASPPETLGITSGKAVAVFRDKSATATDLTSGATSVVFEPSLDLVWSNGPFTVFATFSKATQVEIYDFATDVRWDVPVLYPRLERTPSLSPDGTRMLLPTLNGIFEWRLRRIDSGYEEWLAKATNALIRDGKLSWDWAAKPRLAP